MPKLKTRHGWAKPTGSRPKAGAIAMRNSKKARLERGASLVTPFGTVVEVRAIGSSPEQMTELDVPRPPRGGPKGGPKGK